MYCCTRDAAYSYIIGSYACFAAHPHTGYAQRSNRKIDAKTFDAVHAGGYSVYSIDLPNILRFQTWVSSYKSFSFLRIDPENGCKWRVWSRAPIYHKKHIKLIFFEKVIGIRSPANPIFTENSGVVFANSNEFVFVNRCCKWMQVTHLVEGYNPR